MRSGGHDIAIPRPRAFFSDNLELTTDDCQPSHSLAGCYNELSMGATRFRRKLSRPEGMPGATCPQSGGKLELPTQSWL